MTARNPLYVGPDSNTVLTELISMTSTELDNIKKQAVYQYSLNPSVNLSVVATNGSLASMFDRRYQAGDYTTSGTGGTAFASEAATPDISAIDTTFDKINETVDTVVEPTYTDENIAFPVYWDSGIKSMTKADFYDTFIYPAIDLLETSGTSQSSHGGKYFISISQSLGNATSIDPTQPVFTDRRADDAQYSSDGIPEAKDQNLIVANYYLHRLTGVATAFELPYYINSAGTELRQYTAATFNTMLQGHMRYAAANATGSRVRYNINGTGTNCGTGMADTYLSGSSASGYTTYLAPNLEYRTQEFPNGAVATRTTYYLKMDQT